MPGVPARLRSTLQQNPASIVVVRVRAIKVITYCEGAGVSRASGDGAAATATPALCGTQKYKKHSAYCADETLQHSIGRALWEKRPMENVLAYKMMTAMRGLGVERTQIFLGEEIMVCG